MFINAFTRIVAKLENVAGESSGSFLAQAAVTVAALFTVRR